MSAKLPSDTPSMPKIWDLKLLIRLLSLQFIAWLRQFFVVWLALPEVWFSVHFSWHTIWFLKLWVVLINTSLWLPLLLSFFNLFTWTSFTGATPACAVSQLFLRLSLVFTRSIFMLKDLVSRVSSRFCLSSCWHWRLFPCRWSSSFSTPQKQLQLNQPRNQLVPSMKNTCLSKKLRKRYKSFLTIMSLNKINWTCKQPSCKIDFIFKDTIRIIYHNNQIWKFLKFGD